MIMTNSPKSLISRAFAAGIGTLLLAVASASAATVLPVGPISFDSNGEFDSSFWSTDLNSMARRTISGSNGVVWVPRNGGAGAVVFDTSAIGGSNGSGGTSGSNANNDLSDFVIAGDFFVEGRTTSNVAGFFLRLDDSGSGGYLASIELSATGGTFRLYENVGVSSADAPALEKQVFSSTFIAPTATNTFYRFEVSAEGNTFNFSFNDGVATASYTDDSLSRSTGQAGLYLQSSASYTQFDNFEITAIPEPSTVALSVGAMASLLAASRLKRTLGNR